MSTAIVEIGDVIKPTLATTDAKKEVHIKWSQGHKEKEADYYRGTYTNETKTGKSGIIFIQKSKLDVFQKGLNNDTITISPDFQYGQKDKSGADRWIVFHGKDNKPYQHRFVSELAKKSDTALEVLKKMGISSAEELEAVRNGVGKSQPCAYTTNQAYTCHHGVLEIGNLSSSDGRGRTLSLGTAGR